jgi:hypothetical protein
MQQNWLSQLGRLRVIFRCMSALRLVLIAGNALLFAWTVYIFPSSHATVHTSDYVFGLGVLTCSGLNLIYLLLNLVRSSAVPTERRHVTQGTAQALPN